MELRAPLSERVGGRGGGGCIVGAEAGFSLGGVGVLRAKCRGWGGEESMRKFLEICALCLLSELSFPSPHSSSHPEPGSNFLFLQNTTQNRFNR